LPDFLVTVVIPTLAADSRLLECVQSLSRQTMADFEVVIVDNSGHGLVRRNATAPGARVIENPRNAGFGTAINQGWRASASPYVATLNDDAVAHPDWLAALVSALDGRPDAGMCASQVRLFGEPRLDSAGMLVARDGSSKQRGHGRLPEDFPVLEEVLTASGSAALYRRSMLDDTGGFDDSFFLYCEDTDLGLRARWAGWKCLYAPQAIVEHHYSHSAGGASPLKAYYVERNRLFVLVKNFPGSMLLAAPFVTFARYLWHAWYIFRGQGSAARFRAEGNASPRMLWYVVRAHAALLANLPRLWHQRRQVRASARITAAVFRHLLRSHSIGARRMAAL
jgi:GT2 family glycosyltransferase